MAADDDHAVAFDDHKIPTAYNFSTSTTVYDSLGTPRTVTMYFVKDNSRCLATGKVHVQMDGVYG